MRRKYEVSQKAEVSILGCTLQLFLIETSTSLDPLVRAPFREFAHLPSPTHFLHYWRYNILAQKTENPRLTNTIARDFAGPSACPLADDVEIKWPA